MKICPDCRKPYVTISGNPRCNCPREATPFMDQVDKSNLMQDELDHITKENTDLAMDCEIKRGRIYDLEKENERLLAIIKVAENFVRCRNIKGYDDRAEKSAGWYLEQALKETDTE